MLDVNPLFLLDFYKTGHMPQYPDGTEMVYSNYTCRGDRLALKSSVYDGKTVFAGLSGTIKRLVELFNDNFFAKPKAEVLADYQRRMDNALGKDAVNTDHIAELHDLGY